MGTAQVDTAAACAPSRGSVAGRAAMYHRNATARKETADPSRVALAACYDRRRAMAMRLLDDEALLLEVSDLQEGDRIVSFLTRHHGRKRGAARGARRRYSRFAGQLQPLAKVHVSWFEKEGSDLVRVRAVEMLRPPHRLAGDL
jgi:hypothetical protein